MEYKMVGKLSYSGGKMRMKIYRVALKFKSHCFYNYFLYQIIKMQNTSYFFFITIIFSNILLTQQQSCQANTQIPQFFQTQIKMAMMRQLSFTANNPLNTFNYAVNYPIQLLTKAESNNIGSLACIQKLDIANTGSSIQYRIKQKKSAISLLLTMEYNDTKWNNFNLNILLYNTIMYPNIVTGELSVINGSVKTSTSASATLPSTFKSTKAQTVAFISGVKMSLQSPNNFQYQVQLTDSADLNTKLYTVTINIGQNTILSELYVNYIIFGQDSSYEIYGSYATFTQIKEGAYSQYMGQCISSNSYLFVGLNSLKIKQGPGPIYFGFDIKENGQNLLQMDIKQPASILKIGIFRIGNTPENLCKDCGNQKIIQNYGSTTQCINLCTIGSVVNNLNSKSTKCLKCPDQLLYISNSQSGCSCQLGQSVKNGICQAQATNSIQNSDYLPTFTSSNMQCNDPNSYKNFQGQCICKPGYSQAQLYGINQCSPICTNGYYNGQSCVSCPEGTFPWNQVQACYSCGDYCSNCKSQYSCQQCKTGFHVNTVNQQCTQTCGDGISITTQCDDGNNLNGDGCSSACQIQDGFICQTQAGGTKSICTKQTTNIQRKSVEFLSGNLVIEYQILPTPIRQYSSLQLSNIFNLKFISSPPYQTYFVQNPSDLSNFRIVGSYGGIVPLSIISAEVKINMPNSNNNEFKETVTYNPIGFRTTFARRTSGQEDTLS